MCALRTGLLLTLALTGPALGGCATPITVAPSRTPAPTVRVIPQASPVPATAVPSPAPGQWRPAGKGIDVALFLVKVRDVQTEQPVMIARIDPAQAELKVAYDPATPHTVRQWRQTLDADIVINAGYFTEQHAATGLVIADGKTHGKSYEGYGGMFALRNGKPSLQWLAATPYRVDKGITSAVQAFPMLMHAGKVTPNLPADARPSFRSFVGMDKQGRVLLGVAQSPVWTLGDLAQWLASQPQLNLDAALNLDGGASTGMWLRDWTATPLSDSFDVVPSVIVVKSRR